MTGRNCDRVKTVKKAEIARQPAVSAGVGSVCRISDAKPATIA